MKLKYANEKLQLLSNIQKKLQVLSEFENMSADEHIINLSTMLERLGNVISIIIFIQLWRYASVCMTREMLTHIGYTQHENFLVDSEHTLYSVH